VGLALPIAACDGMEQSKPVVFPVSFQRSLPRDLDYTFIERIRKIAGKCGSLKIPGGSGPGCPKRGPKLFIRR
jgi:hypothetical protein